MSHYPSNIQPEKIDIDAEEIDEEGIGDWGQER